MSTTIEGVREPVGETTTAAAEVLDASRQLAGDTAEMRRFVESLLAGVRTA